MHAMNARNRRRTFRVALVAAGCGERAMRRWLRRALDAIR